MRKLILSLLVILIGSSAARAASVVEEPDFAFPQTVITNADSVLRVSKSPVERMAAVMQIASAKFSVDNDSIGAVNDLLTSAAARTTDPAARALLNLYRAQLLCNFYSYSSDVFDRVDAPLNPIPANPAEWSGDQFRYVVRCLIDDALDVAPSAKNIDLTAYKDIIWIKKNTLIFYPKLSDFIYLVCSDIATYVDDSELEKRIIEEVIASEPAGTPQWAVWLKDNPDRIREAFEKYPTGLTGGYLLDMLTIHNTDKEYLIAAYKNYLSTEPVNIITPALKSYYEFLTLPKAVVECRNSILPGNSLKVKVVSRFADRVGIILYRVKDPKDRRYNIEKNIDKIDEKEIVIDTPDVLLVDSVYFDIKEPGIYLVSPIVEGMISDDGLGRFVKVIATPYAPLVVRLNNVFATALVSMTDGSPVKDADINLYNDTYKNESMFFIGRTDSQGIARAVLRKDMIKNGLRSVLIVKKGKNEISFGTERGIYYYPEEKNIDGLDARFFLSRPIYHPGEDVEWSMVLGRYDATAGRAQICPGIEVDICLRDTHYEIVDSVTLTTDANGRVAGSFKIPTDRLNGYYNLELKSTSYAQLRPQRSTQSFMVSDFKAADTELTDVKVEMNGDGSSTVTGRLVTMSGMGIADGKVTVRFDPLTYWWWWRFYTDNAKSATLEASTDEKGYFTVTAKPSELTPKTDYTLNVRAVAPSGETADDYAYLYNSDVVAVQSEVTLWNTDDKKTMPVYAERSGKRLDVDASWTLLRDGNVVGSGICRIDSTGTDIDLAAYPAAAYKLAFKLSDDLKVVGDTIDITTYSVARNAVPDSQKLLMPITSLTIKPGDKTSFKLGVPQKESVYIFYLTATDIEKVERKELKPGFHDIELPEFKSGRQMRVIVATLDGDSFIQRELSVNYENLSQLDLNIESWRDKLIPNTAETITFKLSHLDGTPVNGGFVATMYNRALDKLQQLFYPDSKDLFPRFSYYNNIDFSVNPFISHLDGEVVEAYKDKTTSFYVQEPEFSYNIYFQRYNHGRPCIVASFGQSQSYKMDTEMMAANGVVRPMTAMLRSANTADAVEAVEDEAVAEPTLAAGAPAPEAAADAVKDVYREGEVLQAFFRPDMSFGADGSATLTYTVPNANGSWKFIATAWDQMAYCATQMRTAVASKPVMVQPNVPRFLREGDRAEVSVAVFNNTDADGSISCLLEVFDPNTGEVISSDAPQLDVKAGASVVRTVSVTAPVGSQAVGLRAKATLGNYTDGEQNLIPILASGMTVVDSETFYLTDANPNFVSTIPSSEDSADFTLQYCANPVWDVVKALPSLYNATPKTAIDAAYSIYSALTARGLSRRFPEINRAIDMWTASPADSALVSKLYKNEDLKLATLQQTPWMQAAASQTERMSQLALTFDKAEINRTFDAAVDALDRLQRTDGGFAWGSWSEKSSLWTTCMVLETLGRLNSWGFLTGTAKLDKIIDRAFTYVDANVRDTDFGYAYLMTCYPDRKPSTTTAQAVLHKTLQFAAANWRKASTSQKARWAVMLNGHGYGAVAKEIVASLRQFEVHSPQAGISFPSVNSVDTYSTILQAFAAVDPVESELDAMRQWLVLRTQVSDDLMACDRRSLISAILSTGSRWTTLRAAKAPVTVGGSTLDVDRVEAVTGTFSVKLPAGDAGKGIRVIRPAGNGVSYGSLTSVYNQPLDRVEARGSSEISISKRFLVQRGGEWVETSSVSVGELVRVQLKVQISRDMEYLTVIDRRPAAFEPVDQVPGYVYSGGAAFYRENNDSATNLFIGYLPRGTYYITYDMNVSVAGAFASGPAAIQSQYAPELNARSGSSRLSVKTFGAE